MSNDHHHSGATHLAELAILAAILTLPSSILWTAAKRLAILVGSFIAIVALIGGAYAVFTPTPTGCDATPTLAAYDNCKKAEKRAKATHPCKDAYEDAIPGSDCYQP
jgi:hypothetical protein